MNKFSLSSSDRPQISVSNISMSRGGAEIFDAWMCLFFLRKNRCSQVSKILALFTSECYVLNFAFQKMKKKIYLSVRTCARFRARVRTFNILYGLLSNPSAAILPPYTQMAKNGSIFRSLCQSQ